MQGAKIMCIYCSTYPYPYSPYSYPGYSYGYPPTGYGSPYYGLPLGYTYSYPVPAAFPAPVVAAAPMLPRGEHRVGNCLCICQ
jgi:hypothetical protein